MVHAMVAQICYFGNNGNYNFSKSSSNNWLNFSITNVYHFFNKIIILEWNAAEYVGIRIVLTKILKKSAFLRLIAYGKYCWSFKKIPSKGF